MTWSILVTVPGRERGVAATLALAGGMAFCPLVRLSRRRIAPMFPGYLFAILDAATQYAIEEIDGVRVMVVNERAAILSNDTMGEIRRHAESLAQAWRQPFRKGDRVIVTDLGGVWESVEGLVARLDSHENVVLEAFLPEPAPSRAPGRPRIVRMTLPAQWLEPANPRVA
jgi:hypothetical protein